jgi:glycosyltransferase involved in cell wall biosynthesis
MRARLEGGAMRKLLFLATEDWFVASHFLPLVRRARAEGYEVAVATRGSGAELAGARLLEMDFPRGALGATSLLREAAAVRALLQRERPDIVHAIALKPIALALLAGAQGAGLVMAVTGRGYLAVRGALWTQFVLDRLAGQIRRALARGNAQLLVENEADLRWVAGGGDIGPERAALMPGAGIDPERFAPAPEPDGPIVVGIAARLIWSKGIDLAVEAVRRLRGEGLDISLRIAGGADVDNPEHVAQSELALWGATPGVSLLGRVGDIAGFWAGTHIACLPSRGGEGLPRSLLEAAACGRAIVTSDAPGCADFVAGGAGLIAAREDVGALAQKLALLASDATLRARLAQAARARVLAGYTEAHAADCAAAAWARLRYRPESQLRKTPLPPIPG